MSGSTPNQLTLLSAAAILSDAPGRPPNKEEAYQELLSAFWRGELTREDGETAVFTLETPEGCSTDGDGNVLKTIGVWLYDPDFGPYETLDEYVEARTSGSFDEDELEPIDVVTAERCRVYWSPRELLEVIKDCDTALLAIYPSGPHAEESCRVLADRPLSTYRSSARAWIDRLHIERVDFARWCVRWCERNHASVPEFVSAMLGHSTQERLSPEFPRERAGETHEESQCGTGMKGRGCRGVGDETTRHVKITTAARGRPRKKGWVRVRDETFNWLDENGEPDGQTEVETFIQDAFERRNDSCSVSTARKYAKEVLVLFRKSRASLGKVEKVEKS